MASVMKVSFIIPVYKVEQYLRHCVESILNQSYRDLEVILVDDGSPDNCPQICDELARCDSRIIVVHKQNGGLSDARNAGLLEASGEYVVFLDGDDFWVDNLQLEKLIKSALIYDGWDFCGFNCSYYYPESESFKAWVSYSDILSMPIDKNTAIVELVKSGTFPMSACLKLIKRSFLIGNNLLFVKGQLCEDVPWFINVLDKCEKCCFINQYIYAYRQNVVGSISSSISDKTFISLFGILKNEIKEIESCSFNQKAKEALLSFFAYELCILLTKENIDEKTYKELISYSWLLQYDMNPKVKKVRMIKRLLGFSITVKLLKLYDRRRRSHN